MFQGILKLYFPVIHGTVLPAHMYDYFFFLMLYLESTKTYFFTLLKFEKKIQIFLHVQVWFDNDLGIIVFEVGILSDQTISIWICSAFRHFFWCSGLWQGRILSRWRTESRPHTRFSASKSGLLSTAQPPENLAVCASEATLEDVPSLTATGSWRFHILPKINKSARDNEDCVC